MRKNYDADLADAEIAFQIEDAAGHQDDVIAPIEGPSGRNQGGEVNEFGREFFDLRRLCYLV